jgi:Holliday junction resolvasome RuvABC endonuclease subunit
LIILAIDQATLSGWVVMKDEQVIDKGLIDLKKFSFPYAEFREILIKLTIKYNPDVLVFEDLRSMRNAFTVRKLQQITGIVIEVCESLHLSYQEYLTVSVRAKLCKIKTGERGRATKFDLAHMVCDLYDWDYPIDKNGNEVTKKEHDFFNISDAIGIGLYHYRYGIGKNKNTKETKKKVSKKVIK